ncbi:hypothetical protein [Sorangium sp. So ce117]|uniref:hypothetical protein n=1 Tax=Sorangium sp. So ce117 TaxID=3133277 RepID=UPI003F5E4201
MANETSLRRPNYFPGEFLTVADYTAEQGYVDALRCAHDFGLHTWGIAVGLDVTLESGMVTVSPGIAFDRSEHILVVDDPWSGPTPSDDATLVARSTRKSVYATNKTRVPWTREQVKFSWYKKAEIDVEREIVLAELSHPSSSPVLTTRCRRYVSMSAGALRFAHALLPSDREPRIVGWSAGDQESATTGLRASADEVRFRPRSGGAPAVKLSVRGPVTIGTTIHRAVFEVRAPNAPLAGPGTIRSSGKAVSAAVPGNGAPIRIPIDRIVAPGDRIFTQNLAGNPVQADVKAVGPGETVSTSEELNAEDATWTFQRARVARFARGGEAALLVCNVGDGEPRVGLGTESPEECLAVSGGDVRLTRPEARAGQTHQNRVDDSESRGGNVVFAGGGGIQSRASIAPEIRFEERGGVELRTEKTMELTARPSASPPDARQVALHLSEDGTVRLSEVNGGHGQLKSKPKLIVEGAIRASKGFIFPDGTEQQEAVIAVPIGGIIDWWRPDAKRQIPDGFAVCDGSKVSAPGSSLDGKTLPDLTGYFVRGAWDASQISTQGNDGTQHVHTFGELTHQHLFQHSHTSSATVDNGADGAGQGTGPGASCILAHEHTAVVLVDPADNVMTGASSEGGSRAPGSTDPYRTGPAAIMPPYIKLLKLMRIQ